MTSLAPRRRMAFKQQPETAGTPGQVIAPPIIRRTTPDDVETLQGLHLCQLALADIHHVLYSEEIPEFCEDEWYEKLFCGNLSEWLQRGVEILHAKVEGAVVGYVSFWPPKKEDDEPSVTINHIIVMEGYRGHGIGKQLMDSLVRYLNAHAQRYQRGACQIRLAVASANTQALEWYRGLGFEEEERLKEALSFGGGKASSGQAQELLWVKMLGTPSGNLAVSPQAPLVQPVQPEKQQQRKRKHPDLVAPEDQ